MKKKIGIAFGIVAFFLLLSYAFVPQVLEGQIVNQSDIAGYSGMAHEMSSWNQAHPEDPTYWTGAMFSGMPTTPISNQNGGDLIQYLYDALLWGKRPATYLFITLLGGFLLMLAFGAQWLLAVGGAVSMAFCSYNMQIINVGHNTKMQAIAFLPWVLAALVFTYRQARASRQEGLRSALPKLLLGAALFGIAVSLEVKANHQQITYYLVIMILLYGLTELLSCLIRKTGRTRFFLASGLLVVTGLIGAATGANKLLPLWEYTPYSIRGGSELSTEGQKGEGGLDIHYATAWSYGWEELPNLLIPHFNGGGTANDLSGKDLQSGRVLRQYLGRDYPELSAALLYDGPQPGTAGPMYMGAISIFLFLMALILYDGKEKWWAGALTLLSVLLAVGHHFLPFTEWAFRNLPMYNKFRSVSMALIILQYLLPLLGFLCLDRICKGEYETNKIRRAAEISLGIVGGFSLLLLLFPALADSGDIPARIGRYFGENLPQDFLQSLRSALVADKAHLVRQDALVALLLVCASFLLLLWALRQRTEAKHSLLAFGLIGVLSLVNLFAVGKHYLNADDFTSPKAFSRQFALRSADREILQDKDLSYRVLDLSEDPWNSSVASYHHKSIGGYSPAKLQRYQDLYAHPDGHYGPLGYDIGLLQNYLGRYENTQELMASLPLLAALNMRYVIAPDGKVWHNDFALGNAWVVDSLARAGSVEEEYALLEETDLRHCAILGPDTEEEFRLETDGEAGTDAGAVLLTAYAPNELHYQVRLDRPRPVVFSEIWYPGWRLSRTDSGEELPLLRADWTLRAALLPAGQYDLVMRFEPASYAQGRRISFCSSLFLLLLSLAALGWILAGRRRSQNP